MQLKMEEDSFVEGLIFSDEATFHVSGEVNSHNVGIWGKPHTSVTLQKSTFFVRCPARKCTAHFSSLKQL
jgi:hypothetical protein